ncbi:hypothetical protein BB559_005888 [Furculomyces boomerangus]|uniref:YCII-related domain-containing protein n=2 Tax=Harpellales TaxID=61421 RepID=A0A2T9Y653_9FUNG|nr:hypothetical protein BB559_005888 [Furculomyces boomerangus]PVZ97162.1 hypothetical protein BB558_006897 [Smittium angustum]
MSQQTPQNSYFATIQDHSDADCLSRRTAALEPHIAGLKSLKQNSFLQTAGGTFDKDGKMSGSILLYNADTEQQVREMVENDPFCKERVWDINTLVIQRAFIPTL